MFRVQFSGESKEEALEHCCGCVQSLAQYVTVQEPDSTTQELPKSPGPQEAGEMQGKDPLQGVSADDVWCTGGGCSQPPLTPAARDPICSSGPPLTCTCTHTHQSKKVFLKKI